MSSEGESTQTDRSPCKGKSIMNGYFRLFRATVRFPDTRNKEKRQTSSPTCILSTLLFPIIYIIRIQPQKNQRLICSFVHKGSILTVLALDYSSTSIGLLQYSLLDYSSTCIGLLQYFYRITPVLLSESIKVLTHASPPNPFPHQLVNPFPCQLVNL